MLCAIPTSICNLRCRYCYLSQRDISFQGKQAEFQYSPEYIGAAFSVERLGGICYFNFCADGETLLTKDIDKYIYEIVKQGHYAEIVTNLTITPMLEKILSWDKEILERIEFKCSFHYLQLKERDLLNVFADNVKKIWSVGSSANIEITPDDELIPFIDEVKEFSLEHFGALPHLTIARDDRNNRDYLTELSQEEYQRIWEQFESSFWQFKREIFNKKREEYCYAGVWSMNVNMATGKTKQCYRTRYTQNIYENIEKPIELVAIGKCKESHCYNGHALLTLGCIPGFTTLGYGDVRDREKVDGSHWLQPKLKAFFNSKLEESNEEFTIEQKKANEEIIVKYNEGEQSK